MTDLIERTLYRLGEQRPGLISRPGDEDYAAATAIWAKPFGLPPHEPLGMLADHDEFIDAEARQPLTSRQFDIECGASRRSLSFGY
jgi:hypothetical protein